MRPLDRVSSIKVKLGVIVVASVAGTTVAILIGVKVGLGWIVSLLLGGVLGLLAIQVLARGMTSPLREMVSATQAMVAGDYSRRIRASSRDEVGELARAFNQMASELAEVDRVRRDLIANVSHELRTPITALQAVLENAVDGVAPTDEKALNTMLAQVQRLARLVDQLLELSKLESGVLPLKVATFSVGRLLEQVVQESSIHAEQAHGRRVSFELRVDPQGLTTQGDAERIHQVVSNLIENAVRHSPEGGTVLISARQDSDNVILQVADEGPGVQPEERERVFERFYRSDVSRSSDSGGSGLGLAIARWIVDLHGGRISVGDNQPKGCRVSVVLPTATS